jgi:hypothetical protein
MPTHETGPPVVAVSSSSTPTVEEVIRIVQEWVDLHARQLPDFAGAYLWGGITALPSDAPFHLYRDVDVMVVWSRVPSEGQGDTQEVFYGGVMLEILSKGLDAHSAAEAVLADPSHGPNMATTQILADPTGILVPLQQAVAAGYGRQRWIRARCEAEKRLAEEQLAKMRKMPDRLDLVSNQEALSAVWELLSALSGLLAVAQLERPTTRRTLSLLRELLHKQGRPDLHEEVLRVWGSSHMSRAEVQVMLDQSVVAFDRAVEVYRTPTPYGFTIRAHLRPYLEEATQEMIEEGHHREATFWIMALATESYLVLQNDAPDAEKQVFAEQLQAMLATLEYKADSVWADRVATAEHLTQEIYVIVERLVALYPE